MMKLPPKAARILDRLCQGLVKVGDHAKFGQDGDAFMPVCIEVIDMTEQGWPIVSVAHYFKQEGDLCCDPDVTILRSTDGDFPMTFQQAIPPIYNVPLRIQGGTIHVGSPSAQKMRLRFDDGTLVTQASLSSIMFVVKDTADLSETGTGTLTISSVISDTLQTSGWEEDVIGWNFSATLAPSNFPAADKLYVVEYTITPASGYAQTISTYVRTLSEDEE